MCATRLVELPEFNFESIQQYVLQRVIEMREAYHERRAAAEKFFVWPGETLALGVFETKSFEALNTALLCSPACERDGQRWIYWHWDGPDKFRQWGIESIIKIVAL